MYVHRTSFTRSCDRHLPKHLPEDQANGCALRSDMIDKNTHEIRQDEDKTVYKSLEEIGDDLPDHSPRFVLLSYPFTTVRSPMPTSFPGVPVADECHAGGRPNVRPVRPAVLPPDYVQCRTANAIRRRQGAHAEYKRGWPGD